MTGDAAACGDVAADQAEQAIPHRGRVLGIDLGSKRVGVAVSDGDQRLATAATTLHRRGDRTREHRELAELVADYEAVGVVFGLPRSLSGAIGPAAEGVLAEVEEVRLRLAVPVELIDERLTTVAASSALRAAGRAARQQRSVIDKVAAAVLLQSWLDRRARQREVAGHAPAEVAGVDANPADQPRTAEMEHPGNVTGVQRTTAAHQPGPM
jgi:putative holliday junction resolvase